MAERPTPNLTALLVEDDENAAELFKHVLRRVRCPGECRVVHDGEAAVSYLLGRGEYADRERHPLPCLLVLDLLMPRMNGFEFLEWLKKHREFGRLPIFVYSICDGEEDIRRAKGLGVKVYWIKTGDLRRLTTMGRRIATYLRQFCSRVRREMAADEAR
ncbi:MAG TPA: response regulator [Planctomycetota bacterium]|nr:response regulator [Planctomycetota bacterium]